MQNKSHNDFVSSSEVIKTIEISNQFRANNQFTLALKCLEDLNKRTNYNQDIIINMAITYYSYGNFALNNHNHILSINCLEKATFYLDKKKDSKILVDIYIKLAHCYQTNNNIEMMKWSHQRLNSLEEKPPISNGLLLYSKLHCAEFNGRSSLIKTIKDEVKQNNLAITPFTSILISDDPNFQSDVAKEYSKKSFLVKKKYKDFIKNKKHKKIKVGYLSSDFHYHATSHLIIEMFEKLSHKKFDYYCFSYGKTDNSEIRQRIEKCFKNFFEVEKMSDQEIATLIKKNEIDILIDLKGHTKQNRINILSYIPSPIQISYLGYPGTLGTNFIDYLIMDEYVVNKDDRKSYNENIIYLPDTYQCNSKYNLISNNKVRDELNLPKNKIILCSLNNTQKYNKKILSIWAEVLIFNKKTILWLLEENQIVKKNIISFFKNLGVEQCRIIFSPRTTIEKHLIRLSAADLFLDSFPCNAHTTASDALSVNLPIVTLSGRAMASRVSGSFLNVLKLNNLIANNYEEYKNIINYYVNNLEELKKVREKIKLTKNNKLFNSRLFTQNMEKAYKKVWQHYLSGKKIADIYIKPGDK